MNTIRPHSAHIEPDKPDCRRIMREVTLDESDMIDSFRKAKEMAEGAMDIGPEDSCGEKCATSPEPIPMTERECEKRIQLRIEAMEYALRSCSGGINFSLANVDQLTSRAETIFNWITR